MKPAVVAIAFLLLLPAKDLLAVKCIEDLARLAKDGTGGGGGKPARVRYLSKKERDANWAKIQELATRNLEHPDIVGYHGTSLEALEYLRDYGVLARGKGSVPGAIYFYPVPGKFPKMPAVYNVSTAAEAVEETQDYADQLARDHHLLRLLGLSLNRREIVKRAADITARWYYPDGRGEQWLPKEYTNGVQYFASAGIALEPLEAAAKKAILRKGVVLALGPTIPPKGVLVGDQSGQTVFDYRTDPAYRVTLEDIVAISLPSP